MKLLPTLKISQRLPLAVVGSAIVVGAGIGVTSYLLAANALESQARQNLATLRELAEVILFLASDAASGVTGALIPVSGRV